MDIKDIEKIIKTFEASELQTLEIELNGAKIKLSKRKDADVILADESEKPKQQNEFVKIDTNKNEPNVDLLEVKSPLVGTFYAAASPKDDPFVKVGDTVKAGQPLCIIEAMKIMNEIQAPVSGVIEEVKAHDNKTIGYDDVLFLIRETHAK